MDRGEYVAWSFGLCVDVRVWSCRISRLLYGLGEREALFRWSYYTWLGGGERRSGKQSGPPFSSRSASIKAPLGRSVLLLCKHWPIFRETLTGRGAYCFSRGALCSDGWSI